MTEFQWLTTAPNPRSSATGVDAGQRGWKLHCVMATETETFASLRWRRAACGLMPNHGWSLDLFIQDKCDRCSRVKT